MSWVLAIFGVLMVGSGLCFISSNFGAFAQEKTFLDFITPIFLSISLLPFIFIFSVYMLYENILVRINIYTDNHIHRLYGKFKGLVHFKRDHKGLNDWLAFACISDFKSIKAIDQSIINFNIREKELVYRDRKEPHSSPLPHHRTYGSVYGDSADQNRSQIQGNESPRDLK